MKTIGAFLSSPFTLGCIVVTGVISVSTVAFVAYDMNNITNEYNVADSGFVEQFDSRSSFRGKYDFSIKSGAEGTGDNSTSAGSMTNVKGDGQLIIDETKNPYAIPLYDGLTFDADAMGIESYSVPYANNPFPVIQDACKWGNYIVTNENRRCEGGSASWNWYDEINYSPTSKCGEKLPYTEVDGRISIAVPWRWTVHPSTFPFDQPAGNMRGSAETAGLYYDVVFDDGTVLACIGGSAKGVERDTNSKYQGYMHYSACPIEIVQYTDLPVGRPWADGYKYAVDFCNQRGIPTESFGPVYKEYLCNGKSIQEVIVYRIQHYTLQQGYKNWFTGD